jgi:hypothetical protein
LEIAKVTLELAGTYACRLENVAGSMESFANLAVVDRSNSNTKPGFVKGLQDQRVLQNSPVQFNVQVSGNPLPDVSWFKVKRLDYF